MRTFTTSLVLLLLLFVPASAQKGKGKPAAADSAKITQLKQALAAEVAGVAKWCDKNMYPVKSMYFVREALALDPENKEATSVDSHRVGGEVDNPIGKEYQRKLETSGKKIAPMYCELFLLGPAKDRKEFDAYIVLAFGWDEENTDKWVEAAYKKAYSEKNFTLVGAMLNAALPHQKAESKLAKAYVERAKILRECEAKQASQSPLLKKARTHTMQYYLSLPNGWTAESKWPILVAVDGAGSNFAGMNGSYGGKNNTTYIVITPCSFSNTNSLEGQEGKYPYPKEVLQEWNDKRMDFDDPGVQAAVADAREDWNGEDKFFLTGFSGGGNITWHFIFTHPEMLAGAAPASANFGGLRAEASKAPEREKLPIKVFQGEDDEYRKPDSISPLDRQWEGAKLQLEANGYKNWSYELVPKTGHSACQQQVLKFFAETRAAKVQAAADGKKK